MIPLANIIEGAALLIACAILGFLLLTWQRRKAQATCILADAQAALDLARREAETIKHQAKLTAIEDAATLRAQTEATFAPRRQELADTEKRLGERESIVNSQLEIMVRAETTVREQQETLKRRAEELEGQGSELARLTQLRREQLAGAAHMSEAEARGQLRKEIEQEAVEDASNLARHIMEEAKAKADEKARQIISVAIQRYAGAHTSGIATTTVALPGEEMKGRIIGRDGRNIRAFETATGVTVLIDDTPNAVVLSGFDPVRREIAREAMTRLIADGRIHPTRIEEVAAQVGAEMEETIVRLGETAVHDAGLPPAHPEIVKVLGRLHFRQSYSQNVLSHSVEVAHLMALMAAELGLDVDAARRAGLLHDIGKAVSHEVEGPHAVAGAELIRRYGESEVVVNAVASHHNDVPPIGPLGILVSAADAISASRPGARAEHMATYIKRIESLEKIALTFPGVEKSFAAQAGRELRVFVHPEKISDEQAFALARKVAAKIEEELQYPGQIKITVIRETRCVELAK